MNTELEIAAEQSFKTHHIGQQDLAQDVYEDGFKAGVNWQREQDLPIIKELLETLIQANLYVPPKFYGQGVVNDDYLEIQKTLDKYQNYL